MSIINSCHYKTVRSTCCLALVKCFVISTRRKNRAWTLWEWFIDVTGNIDCVVSFSLLLYEFCWWMMITERRFVKLSLNYNLRFQAESKRNVVQARHSSTQHMGKISIGRFPNAMPMCCLFTSHQKKCALKMKISFALFASTWLMTAKQLKCFALARHDNQLTIWEEWKINHRDRIH